MELFKKMIKYTFENKVVLITGASRGIGKATAIAFAEQGAQVVACYHASREKAISLEGNLKKRGLKLEIIQTDVSSAKEAEVMVDYVIKKYKKIDILVNNAGIRRDNLLAMMSADDWLSVINVNLNSIFNVTKWVSRAMIGQKSGSIINISSASALKGVEGQTNYSASKGAILSFTRSASRELGKFNIRVNNVIPGFIETDMVSGLNDQGKEKLTNHISLGRFGNVEDVVSSVLFLAADDTNYITGQSIIVDGGLCA